MNSSKNIFLIEDDEDDQMFFTECIAKIDNATLSDVATNGREAIEKLEKSETLPDMIFMDINMPFMNGIDCLKEIKNNPRTKNISVVMLSTDTSQAQETRIIGAKAFIKKPSDFEKLKAKVKQMINLDFIIDFQVADQTFLMEYVNN